MATGHPDASGLIGRRSECKTLDRLLASVQAGQSQVLVVRGEAGIGKTALLGYLRERASRYRIVRVAGVQSEMELPFAGLHQLCAPMLGDLEHLPGPQHSVAVESVPMRLTGSHCLIRHHGARDDRVRAHSSAW
jgi:AAA ATPase domain